MGSLLSAALRLGVAGWGGGGSSLPPTPWDPLLQPRDRLDVVGQRNEGSANVAETVKGPDWVRRRPRRLAPKAAGETVNRPRERARGTRAAATQGLLTEGG